VCTEIQVHARRLVLRSSSSSSSGMWNPLQKLVQAHISSFPHTYLYSRLVQWPNDPSLNTTQFLEKFGPSDFWFGRLIWILDANGNLPFQISTESSGWIKGDKPFYSIVLVRRSWWKSFLELGVWFLAMCNSYTTKELLGTPKGTIGRCPSATWIRSIHNSQLCHHWGRPSDLLEQSNQIGDCKILTKMWWAESLRFKSLKLIPYCAYPYNKLVVFAPIYAW